MQGSPCDDGCPGRHADGEHAGYVAASPRIRGPHTARDLSATLALNDSNVVLALQIKPELGIFQNIDRA